MFKLSKLSNIDFRKLISRSFLFLNYNSGGLLIVGLIALSLHYYQFGFILLSVGVFSNLLLVLEIRYNLKSSRWPIQITDTDRLDPTLQLPLAFYLLGYEYKALSFYHKSQASGNYPTYLIAPKNIIIQDDDWINIVDFGGGIKVYISHYL